MSSDEAPPLGQRPTEPTPGKESLEDPRGEQAEHTGTKDGGGSEGDGSCPDCGLPFGQHPDFHAHGESAADRLPGKELDAAELGGDPAER